MSYYKIPRGIRRRISCRALRGLPVSVIPKEALRAQSAPQLRDAIYNPSSPALFDKCPLPRLPAARIAKE